MDTVCPPLPVPSSYIPASRRALEKASPCGRTRIIFDLEDAVAVEAKGMPAIC